MADVRREAEAIRDCMNPREQQMFLRYRAGKALSGLAATYGRAYGGENGVREKLNELERRVQTRLQGSAVAAGMITEDEDLDNSGGLPVRSVPAGTLDGEAAAGEATPTASSPPNPAAASAPVSSPPVELDSRASSPSRDASDEACEHVLAALAGGPKIRSEMAEGTRLTGTAIARAVMKLSRVGRIVERGRFRRPQGGRPARIWALPGFDGPLPAHLVSPSPVAAAAPAPHVPATPAVAPVGVETDDLVERLEAMADELRALAQAARRAA